MRESKKASAVVLAPSMAQTASLLVCGLPEAGRLRVQRREGQPTTLRDVYGAPELLHATPPSEAGLAGALPHLCMPDGVAFCDEPPPPPRFFTTTLPGCSSDGTSSAYLSCCLFFEEIPAARMLPLIMNAIKNQPIEATSPSGSVPRTPPSVARSSCNTHAAEVMPSVGGQFAAAGSAGVPPSTPPRDPAVAALDAQHSNAPSSYTAFDVSDKAPHEPSAANVPTTEEKRKRREEAMKVLRARGLPLGVCAVALQQVTRARVYGAILGMHPPCTHLTNATRIDSHAEPNAGE